MDLRYKNYETIFTWGVGKKVDIPDIRRNKQVCFASAFRDNQPTRTFRVFIHDGAGLGSHYCPFTLQEIKNHIRQAQAIVDFSFSVEPNEQHGYKGYIINIRFNNKTMCQQRYVLTWLRYLYEYPYVFILQEAKRLKNLEAFKFESVANLFVTVGSCYYSYNDGHSIQLCGTKLLTRKKLSRNCANVSRVNAVYGNEYKRKGNVLFDAEPDTDKWTMEAFSKRINTYIERYKLLKKWKHS